MGWNATPSAISSPERRKLSRPIAASPACSRRSNRVASRESSPIYELRPLAHRCVNRHTAGCLSSQNSQRAGRRFKSDLATSMNDGSQIAPAMKACKSLRNLWPPVAAGGHLVANPRLPHGVAGHFLTLPHWTVTHTHPHPTCPAEGRRLLLAAIFPVRAACGLRRDCLKARSASCASGLWERRSP